MQALNKIVPYAKDFSEAARHILLKIDPILQEENIMKLEYGQSIDGNQKRYFEFSNVLSINTNLNLFSPK